MLKYNKSDWHYRLYRRVYKTRKYPHLNRQEPDNFCMYWRRVMFAILIFPFAEILCLGSYLINFIAGEKNDEIYEGYRRNENPLKGFLLYCVLYLSVSLVMTIYYYFSIGIVWTFSNNGYFTIAGNTIIIISTGALLLIFIQLIRKGSKKIKFPKKEKVKKIKSPNIFIERWKAFKGKYCPRIEFEGELS